MTDDRINELWTQAAQPGTCNCCVMHRFAVLIAAEIAEDCAGMALRESTAERAADAIRAKYPPERKTE